MIHCTCIRYLHCNLLFHYVCNAIRYCIYRVLSHCLSFRSLYIQVLHCSLSRTRFYQPCHFLYSMWSHCNHIACSRCNLQFHFLHSRHFHHNHTNLYKMYLSNHFYNKRDYLLIFLALLS